MTSRPGRRKLITSVQYQCLSHLSIISFYLSSIQYTSTAYLVNITVVHGLAHRVGRVLSFFSSRRNRDCPNPSPAGECAPLPRFWGRGTVHSLAREGLGESQFRRGDIHCGTLYIYVLCGMSSLALTCRVSLSCRCPTPAWLSCFPFCWQSSGAKHSHPDWTSRVTWPPQVPNQMHKRRSVQ